MKPFIQSNTIDPNAASQYVFTLLPVPSSHAPRHYVYLRHYPIPQQQARLTSITAKVTVAIELPASVREQDGVVLTTRLYGMPEMSDMNIPLVEEVHTFDVRVLFDVGRFCSEGATGLHGCCRPVISSASIYAREYSTNSCHPFVFF
jgi:hypothetical protein